MCKTSAVGSQNSVLNGHPWSRIEVSPHLFPVCRVALQCDNGQQLRTLGKICVHVGAFLLMKKGDLCHRAWQAHVILILHSKCDHTVRALQNETFSGNKVYVGNEVFAGSKTFQSKQQQSCLDPAVLVLSGDRSTRPFGRVIFLTALCAHLWLSRRKATKSGCETSETRQDERV